MSWVVDALLAAMFVLIFASQRRWISRKAYLWIAGPLIIADVVWITVNTLQHPGIFNWITYGVFALFFLWIGSLFYRAARA